MRHYLVSTILLVFCLFLAAPAPLLAGSISGKITYDGNVPRGLIKMGADPNCVAHGPVPRQDLVVGDGNALANVLVMVKSAPRRGSASKSPVVIDQNGCIYVPHVTGVMVGQPLKFKNSDGILHNVHGLPKQNREFNIGMPPTLKESQSITFEKAERPFPVKCDVHPWQQAYVAVMTHSYFAVTSENGRFTIDGLPDRTYEIVAWHERLGTQSGKVTVRGGRGSADFSFQRRGQGRRGN